MWNKSLPIYKCELNCEYVVHYLLLYSIMYQVHTFGKDE